MVWEEHTCSCTPCRYQPVLSQICLLSFVPPPFYLIFKNYIWVTRPHFYNFSLYRDTCHIWCWMLYKSGSLFFLSVCMLYNPLFAQCLITFLWVFLLTVLFFRLILFTSLLLLIYMLLCLLVCACWYINSRINSSIELMLFSCLYIHIYVLILNQIDLLDTDKKTERRI